MLNAVAVSLLAPTGGPPCDPHTPSGERRPARRPTDPDRPHRFITIHISELSRSRANGCTSRRGMDTSARARTALLRGSYPQARSCTPPGAARHTRGLEGQTRRTLAQLEAAIAAWLHATLHANVLSGGSPCPCRTACAPRGASWRTCRSCARAPPGCLVRICHRPRRSCADPRS